MKSYYKIMTGYKQAELLMAKLGQLGVKQEDVDIIFTQHKNFDISKEALLDGEVTIEDAPHGVVNAYGATFAVVATVASGLMFLASGPIAAAMAGAAVVGGGLALFFNGIGIPEEEQHEMIAQLESGHVFVHVKSDNPAVAELFQSQTMD